MKLLLKSLFAFLLVSLLVTALLAKDHSVDLTKTHFLDIASLKIREIIPQPPLNSTSDESVREEAVATCNRKQVKAENPGNTVFCYADVLGSDFNADRLPLTAALFSKIEGDTQSAIHAAKHTFKRSRPLKTNGFSYPSGHSTEAFTIATLLSDLFPKQKERLLAEAKQKAWNRVELGHHYPTDDYAGEVYGKYLAQEFLKNPAFQKEWKEVRKEVKKQVLN